MNKPTLLSENRGCGDGLWMLFFVAVSMILYWPTRHAGFVTDWFGWQMKYDTATWRDALGSIGYRALHPILHTANLLIYKLFGTNHAVWFTIFSGLHGLNAWMIYNLVRRILTVEGGRAEIFPPLAAALIFLHCPYNAEPLVWRACIHYLLSGFFMLKALHRTLDFLETNDTTPAILASMWLVFGLFTFEWAVAVPVLVVIFSLTYLKIRGGWKRLPRIAGLLFLPQLLLVAVWFFLNQHYLKAWVGHYGEATHLNFSPELLAATGLKYFVKYFLLARYFDHSIKSQIFDGLEKTSIWATGWAILVIVAAVFFYNFKKLNIRTQWGGVAILCFFVAVAPVSNLYFYYLDWSENDRYGYFASVFVAIGVSLLLSNFRGFYPVLIGIFVLASGALLRRTNMAWHDSAQNFKSLLEDFRWFDKDEVIILASPDNLKGVLQNRIIKQENGFSEPLALTLKKPFGGRMLEVVQFGMQKPTDSVKVDVDSTGLVYTINFLQDGNWFMRDGIGATDYETDRYFFKKREWDAVVILKEKKPNSVLIYPVAGKWVEAGGSK